MNVAQSVLERLVRTLINNGVARNWLNEIAFRDYGRIVDLTMSPSNTFAFYVHLHGMPENVLIRVENIGVRLRTYEGRFYVQVVSADCVSSSGLDNLMRDFLLGRRFELPEMSRAHQWILENFLAKSLEVKHPKSM